MNLSITESGKARLEKYLCKNYKKTYPIFSEGDIFYTVVGYQEVGRRGKVVNLRENSYYVNLDQYYYHVEFDDGTFETMQCESFMVHDYEICDMSLKKELHSNEDMNSKMEDNKKNEQVDSLNFLTTGGLGLYANKKNKQGDDNDFLAQGGVGAYANHLPKNDGYDFLAQGGVGAYANHLPKNDGYDFLAQGGVGAYANHLPNNDDYDFQYY